MKDNSKRDPTVGIYAKHYDKAIELLRRMHDLHDIGISSLADVVRHLGGDTKSSFYQYVKITNAYALKNGIIVPELKQIAEQVGAKESDINAWVKVKQGDNRSTSIFIKGRDNTMRNSITSCISAFEDIVKNRKPNTVKLDARPPKEDISIKATLSDMHVGMNPDGGEKSLYRYEYNGDIFRKKIESDFIPAIEKTWMKLNCEQVENLVLCDLGDAADGLQGLTTRGGHQLPQNMKDVDVFRCLVNMKIDLVEQMISNGVAKKVTFQNVCNDNHAGVFAQLINEAVKIYMDRAYDKEVVRIDNLHAFITPRIYGNHCFLITHGKDDKEMKSGLPFKLNAESVAYINNYIKHYNLEKYHVHLEKGDLHKLAFEKETTFDYRNFMSFAPPSMWITHQRFYRGGYAGFSIQTIPKYENEVTHTDYFVNYEQPAASEPVHFHL